MRADDIVVPPGSPKRAVLALLLMNRNRAVAIDSLLTAAWEDTPHRARARTHPLVYMSNLRRLLNTVGVDGKAVLTKVAPGYAINVDDSDVDLGRFIAAKTAGVHAAADGLFEPASQHLSGALAEWRGPVLEDLRDFAFDAFATAITEEKVLAHIGEAARPGLAAAAARLSAHSPQPAVARATALLN